MNFAGFLEMHARGRPDSLALVDSRQRFTYAELDGHASRYAPGQFLTTHDDHIEAKSRRAAYVMNLTPRWRPDWGGLLLFYDRLGNVTRGYTPGFNMLNLFAVPQAHAVSWVTPLAAVPRFRVR